MDTALFEPPADGGFAPKAEVSELVGKKINSVSVASTEVDNLEFTALNDNTFVHINNTTQHTSK